jgi:uncharacterized phage-associated protein
MESFDSVILAKYMLSYAKENGHDLNMTKIQKLLYMAYGHILSTEGFSISIEKPKAWPYGPVFPRVRGKVSFDNVMSINDAEFAELKKEKKITETLELVVNKYSKFTASQLTEWSHIKDGPWDKTTNIEGFKWGVTEIPDELIKDYFLKIKV